MRKGGNRQGEQEENRRERRGRREREKGSGTGRQVGRENVLWSFET